MYLYPSSSTRTPAHWKSLLTLSTMVLKGFNGARIAEETLTDDVGASGVVGV
jgi:hypothetical protein